MRIVGGEFKGRKFNPPASNWPTRPTTDFAKEALFNILSNKFDFSQISVLDLFGGTGNISLEFVSRGVKQVTYVERFRPCVRFLQSLCEELGIEKKLDIVQGNVFKFLSKSEKKFDLIFADPPYDLKQLSSLPELILSNNLLKKDSTLIVEHDSRHNFSQIESFKELRSYGNVRFSFFNVLPAK